MKETGPASPPRDLRGDERTLRLETALRRSEKLAMAGRLAASVMHEINNPSQAIADLVYLIAKEADHPERVRAHAAQIEEQLVRIQYIARQTLSFFRDTPQSQTKDLVPLVETALRYHSGVARREAVSSCEKNCRICCSARFFRVTCCSWFRILCATPRKLSRQAECCASVCGRRRKRQCALTIADNGRGIPATFTGKVFEAFQSDKAEAGNGLGLWICKTIVEKHGGQILWHSCTHGENRGTTFSVSLPLEIPVEQEGFTSQA